MQKCCVFSVPLDLRAEHFLLENVRRNAFDALQKCCAKIHFCKATQKKKKKEAKNEEPRIEFTCFFLQEESYLFFTFLKIYETNSILKNFKGHVFLRFAL